MSVLEIGRAAVEPPAGLPVSRLSASSLNLYSRCPLSWKRKYIDKIDERVNGKMIRGSAAGAALAQYFGARIDGETLSVEETLDEYADGFAQRAEDEDPDWQTDTPGSLKDAGAKALGMYMRTIAPGIIPAAVEREIQLAWEGVDWHVTGFIDLETVDGRVIDYKMAGKKWTADAAAAEIQPDIYLAARQAEGNPADGFDYHCIIPAVRAPSAYVLEAPRSEQRLDALTRRIFTVAKSIAWRAENDCWEGTPPDLAWLCRSCAHVGCDWRRA